MTAFSEPRRVQKYKRVAKPLMVALSMRMIDELGDGRGAGLRVRLYSWTRRGFQCDDTGDFCQQFPAKRLTLYCQTTPLVVRETKLPPAKPSFEDSVLLEQIDDSGLLVTLESSSDGAHQQCQGLDRRAHDRGF